MRNIKPTHRPVINFYAELKQYENLGATNETEVRLAFATLLQHYARQNNLTLICEKSIRTPQDNIIYVDGMLTDNNFGLPRGYWEAKDLHDNLITAVKQKFDASYPQDNILFTTQARAILYQDGQEVMAIDIADPNAFIRVLHGIFNEPVEIANWERAVVEFKDKVPALGKRAAALIKKEEDTNPRFQVAFTDFHRHCQEAINPNLAKAAVEEMLIQHLLTEEIFSTVFDNATKQYQPFDNLCLVDTFDLTAERQLSMFAPENTRRVERQKQTDMFVVIGNPPYNARQMDENDANRNRKYPELDKQIQETYAQASKATNKTSLYDPYVKAILWALNRIEGAGIVAFVTNHNFITGQAFDGMRKHLADACDAIYLLDLGGNVRKGHAGDSNVFDIQVGVSINLFVKTNQNKDTAENFTSEVAEPARIFYNGETAEMPKEGTFDFLEACEHIGNVNWDSIQPDTRHTWLTEGLREDFETFLPVGSKQAKAAKGEVSDVIFHQFSSGVKTNRDAWAINFDRDTLTTNVQRMIETYNAQVFKWQGIADQSGIDIDDFVEYNDAKISWSRDLKAKLRTGRIAEYDEHKVRTCLYRPFAKRSIFFDRILNDVVYVFPSIFPTPQTETENRVICVNISREKPFICLMTNCIPEHIMTGGFGSAGQCFPFYIYNEDGTNRRENITEWALTQFREHYRDEQITKWDIFHYTYALLHHPAYRERYQMNLKRDLPHIPFAPEFWGFVETGRRLAEIHVHYEDQPQYKLDLIETPDMPLDWRVEQMRFSKDKTQIRYNDFLTLAGIPAEAFQYRLGNRSALEWVVDQYRIKTDRRSGIENNPNRADDEEYIVGLIRKVISVSLETVEIVDGLLGLDIGAEES